MPGVFRGGQEAEARGVQSGRRLLGPTAFDLYSVTDQAEHGQVARRTGGEARLLLGQPFCLARQKAAPVIEHLSSGMRSAAAATSSFGQRSFTGRAYGTCRPTGTPITAAGSTTHRLSRSQAMSAAWPPFSSGVSTITGASAARTTARISSGGIMPLPRLAWRSLLLSRGSRESLQ